MSKPRVWLSFDDAKDLLARVQRLAPSDALTDRLALAVNNAGAPLPDPPTGPWAAPAGPPHRVLP